MSKSINTVTISGNLGSDPTVKQFESGAAVTEFTVAVSESFKKDEKWEERTYWIRCKAWGHNGKVIGDMFGKGKPICVTGRLVQEEWEDKEGKKQSKTLVNVDNFIFCGGDRKEPSGAQPQSGQARRPPKSDPDLDAPDDGDDIPF